VPTGVLTASESLLSDTHCFGKIEWRRVLAHTALRTLRAGTRRNRVINNYIGLDRFGRRLPNTGHAVINKGRGNTIRGNRQS
jgi:hypothetical protein